MQEKLQFDTDTLSVSKLAQIKNLKRNKKNVTAGG
jgi:hypothetical protein